MNRTLEEGKVRKDTYAKWAGSFTRTPPVAQEQLPGVKGLPCPVVSCFIPSQEIKKSGPCRLAMKNGRRAIGRIGYKRFSIPDACLLPRALPEALCVL